jgi:signal transduction histidine kinase
MDVPASKQTQPKLNLKGRIRALMPGNVRDMEDIDVEAERALYVAHEVSQPLAATLTNAEAALRWLTREPINVHEARQALKGVIGNSRRAAYAVESVRTSLGPSGCAPKDIDINAVIASVLDVMAHDVCRHDIEVERQFDDRLKRVRSGHGQLECVISNLVRNGIDAIREVEGGRRKLRIRTEHDKQADVLVAVEDSGAGIHPRDANRIFDPFFSTKRSGMGVGLRISRSIIEAHGGQLWATPNSPTGSIFKFVIPA